MPASTNASRGIVRANYECDSFVLRTAGDLLAEMLHLRLTYRLEHIARLGTISKPPAPHDLKDLRNNHLSALQIASNRDDFGEEIL